MEFLNDRIGILLKYGKVLGSLTKRFFYIDNCGNLYYTTEEGISKKFLESKNFKDENFINIIAPLSKKINLSECSVSPIKQYLEDKFNLKGRSYFELYLKTRDYRTILIFAWTEDSINYLREYFVSISNIDEMNSLNDQFGKYDSNDKKGSNSFNKIESGIKTIDNDNYNRINISCFENSEFNMTRNKEKSTQKIFEFAEVTAIDNNEKYETNEKERNINLENIKTDNFNNEINNKNFSFKAIPCPLVKDFEEGSIIKNSENKFLNNNNQKNVINRINKDFKTEIDHLNSKLHAEQNNLDEANLMDDYNSANVYAEALKNKIYHLSNDDKKFVDDLLNKLNNTFVNQVDWDKPFIKLINPSQDVFEYQETLAQMENGSDYSGHVMNSMPNGLGKEFRKDGICYHGEFKNGKWHGQGVITNVYLDMYQGEFINGCICGI